jgi:hypothetical protein
VLKDGITVTIHFHALVMKILKWSFLSEIKPITFEPLLDIGKF